MTSEGKSCLEEARKQRRDDSVSMVREAVRMTLGQVAEDLERATERLNAGSRSKQSA